MKKLISLSASLMALQLVACQSNLVQPLRSTAAINTFRADSNEQGQQARLMETFNGFLGYHVPFNQTESYPELLMEVKSFFFNSSYRLSQRSTLRYSLRFEKSNDFTLGQIRLGRDGVLYLASYKTNGYDYYRVGTYQAFPANAADGEPLKFQLDQGLKLKMSWPGINPMAKHDIQIWSAGDLQAVQKRSDELL